MTENKGRKSVFDKLNGRNYTHWAYRMQLYLKNEKCWDVINEQVRPPTITVKRWDKMEEHANFLISVMVEDNQLPIIKRADCARDAWIELVKHHRKSTFSTKIRLLRKMYREILPKHGNMEDHLSKLMEYYDELCEIGHVVEEEQFVSIILTSVGEEYDHLVTALDCRNEKELTLDLVKCKLLDEYDRKTKTENIEGESAFKIQNTKFCDFCKGSGHLKKSCFKFEDWINRKKRNDVKLGKPEESVKMIKVENTDNFESGEEYLF